MGFVRNRTLTLDEIKATLASLLKGSIAGKAILFGSYARGDADQYSDIDPILIADSERPFVTRFEDFWPLLKRTPRPTDLFIYTPGEFEEMKRQANPLITRALEEGVVIYETA